MEAASLTGPAKNLVEFARRAREAAPGVPAVEVVIATYERGEGSAAKNNFVTVAREAKLTVELIPEKGRFDRSVIAAIRNLVQRHQPDIVQTHNSKSHFLVRLSGVWRKAHWIAFHHGYTATDFKMKCYHALDRWSLRKPRQLITVCSPFAKLLAGYGIPPARIAILHNSVGSFTAADESAESKFLSRWEVDGRPLILCIGRLSSEKGQTDLLHALDHLRRELKHERFLAMLVGEGPDEPSLESFRRQLGLDGHVVLTGLHHDLRPFYTCATMLVMPSHSEGSPNVLLEAFASGVPVVATRVGGIPDIATDGENALLVGKGDFSAMAEAIRRLLDDPALGRELAREALKLVVNQYTPDAYRRKLIGIYQRVLSA